MRQQRYIIQYSVTTHHETVLLARSKAIAVNKVVEVVGDPVDIYSVRVVRPEPKTKNNKEDRGRYE